MYSGGAAPLTRSLAQNVSHPKKVFDPTYALVAFQLSISTNFRDMRGSQKYSGRYCAPYTFPGGKNYIRKVYLTRLNVRKISNL